MVVEEAGSVRAWAWVDHLRVGGASHWCDFSGPGTERRGTGRRDVLPGAAQLEVARRLNELAGVASPGQTSLVEHVLDQGGPGRGQLDLALVGVDHDTDFGAPPVDPDDVPASELLRIALGLLADLVTRFPASAPPPVRRPRPRPWQRDYRVVGVPLGTEAVEGSLLRAGHVPGLRSPVAVVLADDLCTMLSDLWTWRILHGGTARWGRWLADWERQDKLPPRLQLGEIAAGQAAEIGVERVHVAVHQPPSAVASLVGAPEDAVDATVRPSPDAVELVRQANLVLRVLVEKDERPHILKTSLLPLLVDEHGPQRAVPSRHLDWARRRAEGMRDEIAAAGYPVRGDLDALVPAEHLPGGRPTDDGVLDVALRALLRFKERAL